MVLLVTPPLRDWIKTKGINPPTGKTLGFLLFGLMAAQMYAMESAIDAEKKAEQAEEQRKAQVERDEATKALAAEFAAKRTQILANFEQLVSDKKFADADKLLSKYRAVGGNDIKAAGKTLALAKANNDLRNEQNLTLEQKINAYKIVKEAEPDNKSASAALDRFNQQLAKKLSDENEQRLKDEAFAKRKKTIEAQFSSWDGSHPSVENAD